MFISKKKYKNLEKRIADLEPQIQSQQKIKVFIDGNILSNLLVTRCDKVPKA